jgi:chitodextrinase
VLSAFGSSALAQDTIWSNSTTPSTPDSGNTTAQTIGTVFQSSVAGQITGLRFYKAATNTGTHVGGLYTDTGTLLGQVTFSGESASGWQQQNLTTAVNISANTNYVVAYVAPGGHWAADVNYFNSAYTNSPLTAVATSSDSIGNGRYNGGGSSLSYPNYAYNATNYYADVVFSPSSGGSVPGAPSNLTATAASCSQINLSWTASTGTVTGYYVYRNSSQVGTTSSTSYSDTGLAASTQYSYYVVAYNSNGNSGNSNTAQATTPACASYSIWSNSTTPSNPDNGNTTAQTIGTVFQSSVAGQITGLRFYKAATNTGTHVGGLYTDTGTLLGQVTFSGESASGWQQQNLTSAVNISASTNYVVAYLAPNGHWPADVNYFNSAYTNSPLTAVATSSDRIGNGRYNGGGSTLSYPNYAYNATNYYADVVFSSSSGGSVPGAPSNLTATAASCSQINLSWTASTGTVTGYYVYRNSTKIATVSTTSYSDTGLSASTEYSYYVVAYNSNGNSGNSNTAQATTPACGTVPGAPSNLTATAASCSQINLSWTASTGTVTGYYVYQNSTEIGSTASTSYSATGLAASTEYSYYVVGYNSYGSSGDSNTAQATTTACSSALFDEEFNPPNGSSSQVGTAGLTTNDGIFQIAGPWVGSGSNELEPSLAEFTTADPSGLGQPSTGYLTLSIAPNTPLEGSEIQSLTLPGYGYGYYEVRMIVDPMQVAGGCISFFLIQAGGTEQNKTYGPGEFDFEFLTNESWLTSSNTGAVHLTTHPSGVSVSQPLSFNPAKGYHRYGFLWVSGALSFVVDGTIVRTVTSSDVVLPADGVWIMANAWSGDSSWGGGPPTATESGIYDYIEFWPNATSPQTH